MLEALESIIPHVNDKYTLLYGIEVKFYSLKLSLNEKLQTSIKGLYAAGDGAGVTRGHTGCCQRFGLRQEYA